MPIGYEFTIFFFFLWYYMQTVIDNAHTLRKNIILSFWVVTIILQHETPKHCVHGLDSALISSKYTYIPVCMNESQCANSISSVVSCAGACVYNVRKISRKFKGHLSFCTRTRRPGRGTVERTTFDSVTFFDGRVLYKYSIVPVLSLRFVFNKRRSRRIWNVSNVVCSDNPLDTASQDVRRGRTCMRIA